MDIGLEGWICQISMEAKNQAGIWAQEEFGGADLGDQRRAQRLVKIAHGLTEEPGRAVSTACGRNGAQSVSRFFDCSQVTQESVLAPHIEQTRRRAKREEKVFAIQDTTSLDFSSRTSVEGLGPIATLPQIQGLMMHSVLIATEKKTPLGIAGVEIWSRDEEERGKSRARGRRPVCEKESHKWIAGLRLAEACVPPEVRLLVIGDRESDVFALFVAPRRENTEILVRVSHNRIVADDESARLFDAAKNASEVGGHFVEIPRQGSRARRQAKIRVQATRVVIKPPSYRTPDIANTPVEAWVVRIEEVDPPEGVEGLEWTLLTTEPVEDLESAVDMVRAYTARWLIEEFHRVLKSGCRVERMQLENADRLKPAIAVNSVVAWRVLYLTKHSREYPEADANTVATELEVTVLQRWLRSKGEKPERIRTVKEFVRAVALLGGFMGRKHDGNPGPKVLWQGIKRLEDLLAGYMLAANPEM